MVPVSLIGTFGVMYLLGYSLDNLSLMALTISTGFVVDDAIVVLENVTRYIETGVPRMRAALQGAREVAFTVFAMTLALVAVFVPILLMGGREQLRRVLCRSGIYRMPQVSTCYPFDLGDRIEGQIDCFVRLAHRFCIRSGHEAECFAFFEVYVSGMGADAELRRRFFERIELAKNSASVSCP